MKDHSLATFTRQLAESIERLDGYLSLYQIHSVTADGRTLDDNALIDAIAGLRERGIRAGLTVSGAAQDIAIRKSIEVRRDSERVFDSVQATWNLFERGAESALSDAHSAGMKVVIKEALANGRLTHENHDDDALLTPRLSQMRKIAEDRGTTIENARPLGSAVASLGHFCIERRCNRCADRIDRRRECTSYNAELDDQLRNFSISSRDYWRARANFSWN